MYKLNMNIAKFFNWLGKPTKRLSFEWFLQISIIVIMALVPVLAVGYLDDPQDYGRHYR